MKPNKSWTRSQSGSLRKVWFHLPLKFLSLVCFWALLTFGLCILPPASTAAGGRVAISAQGSIGFNVTAVNLADVSFLEITVTFDATTMKNPSVDATRLFKNGTVRTNTAGLETVSFSGSILDGNRELFSGTLAVIRFDYGDQGLGKIKSAMVVATGVNGSQANIPVTINNPVEQKENEKQPLQEDTGSTPGEGDGKIDSPTESGTEAVDGGTSAPPGGNDGSAPARRSAGSIDDRRGASLSGTRTADFSPQGDKLIEFYRSTGVLDRFKELTSFRDAEALARVFRGVPQRTFRQEPAIVLTDGETAVTVTMRLDGVGEETPVVLLRNLHCLSFRNQEGSVWELQALPQPGVLEASITVKYGARIHEYPLTVAPPLARYLAGRSGKSPETYLDHYVRTANTLAGTTR